MLPPDEQPKAREKPHPRSCTVDHLDSRLNTERGKHYGEYRRVAACWQCNADRDRQEHEMMPREELHRRSGRFPSELHHAD